MDSLICFNRGVPPPPELRLSNSAAREVKRIRAWAANTAELTLARQLDEADAVARERLARAVSERDSHASTKSELKSKLDDPRVNEERTLRERIPQVERMRRTAATTVKQLEEEWRRVDAEAKKKYETVDKVQQPLLPLLLSSVTSMTHTWANGALVPHSHRP